MYDFLSIVETKKRDSITIAPSFNVLASKRKDLMIKGGDFYAVWDEDKKLWLTDESVVISNIDKALDEYVAQHVDSTRYDSIIIKYMNSSVFNSIDLWHKYVQKQCRDNFTKIDTKVIFANQETCRDDYATKKLPYSIDTRGECPAYEELMSTLYNKEERDKLEWAVGSIFAGDSKTIQKFIVLYGEQGAGKGTFIKIVQQLFDGYWTAFDTKAVGSANDQFALEPFKNNPLVAIDVDGDLSKIDTNTRLNALVSHESIIINEKHKNLYSTSVDSFIFVGTNKPVKITDAKSGIIRRLIDVNPSGRKVSSKRYRELTKQIQFELGAIANHCIAKYRSMGSSYYNNYIPISMIGATNDFYDFMLFYYDELAEKKYVTLKDIWEFYKIYCDMARVSYPMPMRAVKNEAMNYFRSFENEVYDSEVGHLRSVYIDLKKEKFKQGKLGKEEETSEYGWLEMKHGSSIFDVAYADSLAQYATGDEKPQLPWANVLSTLNDIKTSKLHYVKPKDPNLIVIDFDKKGPDGNKSFEENVKEALKWPPTYAELSKGGEGIHLHYIYDGDVSKLSAIYDTDIEIKVFKGKSSLRRKLTKCNDLQIAHISSGLPLKEETDVIDFTMFKNEKALRTFIKKNLNKEYPPHATKTSIDFILKGLEQCYNTEGFDYDVSNMRQAILYFASNSSHNADYCIEQVSKMPFRSKSAEELSTKYVTHDNLPYVFFDIEVFPNLCLVNWKFRGKPKMYRLINPTPSDIEKLCQYNIIGFNNRRYDNHILYAIMQGYTNEELYILSSRLVNKDKTVSNNAAFANAWNLSYTDIYDFLNGDSKKSLKKWEIDLRKRGIKISHKELGFRWDEPVPKEKWNEVSEYCDNDVIATEAVFEANQGDWIARQILAELSGLSVNHTTNAHTIKIIFGNEKKPQSEFVYTDLSTLFPGYKFDFCETVNEQGKKVRTRQSTYLGEVIGEGGYVYAEPGMYDNVKCFDVESMHPNSLKQLNAFGDRYTARFYDIVKTRLAIKHKQFDIVRKMFDGKLEKYLDDTSKAKDLAFALKIAINSVYGLTSANYENECKDPRNIDNIVAKRGALFMCTLKHELQKKGVQVIHIKTDSIKLSNPTKEIEEFVMEFGKKYGYKFDIEHEYSKLCLVNKAVYIGKLKTPDKDDNGNDIWWDATGDQFKQPYVYKTLFSHEPITFWDMCETKSVTTAMYLDMDEDIQKLDHSDEIRELRKNLRATTKGSEEYSKIDERIADLKAGLPEEHNYQFVGRVGAFCPIKAGCGGGRLMAEREDRKGKLRYSAVEDSTGYRWLEAESVESLDKVKDIDTSYYIKKVDEAKDEISKYGDFEMFAI